MGLSLSILGDSILMGITLGENDRYVVNKGMGEEIAAGTGMPLRNLSHMGYTTDRALCRGTVEKLRPQAEGQLVILEYGGNDCDYDWKAISDEPQRLHDCHVPLERFLENYRKLINAVRAVGGVPVAANLMPLDANRYFNWFCKNGVVPKKVLEWLKEVSAIYRWQEMYSVAIEKLARSEHVPVLDLRTPFLMEHDIGANLSADGIHPSPRGQRLLCRAIQTQLPAIAAAV